MPTPEYSRAPAKETSLHFSTIQDLENFLRQHIDRLDEWGQGEARTVQELYNELQRNDVNLIITPAGILIRRVSTIAMDVYHRTRDGRIFKLREDHQERTNPRTGKVTVIRRNLNTSLGEKQRANEGRVSAAKRALREEVLAEHPLALTHRNTVEHLRERESYPGLMSAYTMHYYDAWISEDEFRPEGYIEAEPHVTSYRVWDELPPAYFFADEWRWPPSS